jgi:hypothetical protein
MPRADSATASVQLYRHVGFTPDCGRIAARQRTDASGQAPTHALQQKCILGPLLASDMKEVRKPSGPTPGLDRRSSYTRACDRLVSFRQRRVVDVPMVAAGVVGRVIRLIKRGTGAGTPTQRSIPPVSFQTFFTPSHHSRPPHRKCMYSFLV